MSVFNVEYPSAKQCYILKVLKFIGYTKFPFCLEERFLSDTL